MPHTARAFDALEKNIAWFKENAGNPYSFLYIGWRRDCKRWWYDTFAKGLGVKQVSVLEIFGPNAAELEQQVWAGKYDVRIFQGDVREPDKVLPPMPHDVVFWDHGPEHVTREEFDRVTQNLLTNHTGKLLLYCAPWGDWPQGIEDNNEHEIHRTSIHESDFLKHGLTVSTLGKPGQPGEGEIIGFKFIEKWIK